jgi:RND family efflux transporter MFP subunit
MNVSESDQVKPPAAANGGGPPPARLLPVASVVLVVIVLAVIAGLLPRWRQRAALAAEHRELSVVSVSVVSPAPNRGGGGLLLPAEIKPWIEAPIYARASGYLKRWLVDIGTKVEAGQLLAEIETPELDQERERARHEVAQSEAALALSKITADRYADLVKTASVSEQENAEKQADLKLKTASVAAGRANVARLEKLQSFGRVTAPFAGTITARKTDVGELVAATGGKELFRLAQTDKLRVQVRVPQAEAGRIAPGLAAELVIPEQPGRVFTGQVARTSGEISADSRTLLTEVEVDNASGQILSGSFAQARFVGGKQEGRLALPANTLLFRAEGPQVGVVQPDGKVELRTVKLGRDFGQVVEILGGVSLTNQVIINPSNSLASGMTVRVAEVVKMETLMPAQGMPGAGRSGQGMPGGGMSGQGMPGQGRAGEGKGEAGKQKNQP